MTENEVFKVGYEACLKNAELWLNEGNDLYENESYGHACVLWIHGLEGLIHSWYSWLVYIEAIRPNNKDFLDMFIYHKLKFQAFFGFILGKMITPVVQSAEDKQAKAEEIEKAIDRDMKILADGSSAFAKECMVLRNRGIYVNFFQDEMRFESPETITKEEALAVSVLINSAYEVVFSYIHGLTEEGIKIIKKAYQEIYPYDTEEER